jgi:4-hydroxythreonine-4-phosphate dehydrogenase
LVVPLSEPRRGNFLTFDLPDAEAWQTRLEQARIVTDRRATRLRFGFGIYQTAAEVDALLARLRSLAPGATPPRPAPGLPREAGQGSDGAMNATAPLALTMGEPAGIGPEITLAAWQALRATGPAFFLIGDPALLQGAPIARIAAPEEAAAVFPDALPVLPLALAAPARPGHLDAANASAVIAAIEQAVAFAKAGRAAGVVTNPIQKSVLTAAGFPHPGHTEFLGELAGLGVPPVMMLACPELRVVPVTVHEALAKAIARLTPEMIIATSRIVDAALKRDFGITAPRLAIAGLNPHAGEAGTMGREEIDIIAPAIAALRAEGIDARGPMPPDTMFTALARPGYDVAICLYHDQALIPIKTIDMAGGVNVTLGLSIIRTSPDHGTALDIAGKGLADPASLIAAIRLAGDLAAKRGLA